MKILNINKGWATNSSSYSIIYNGTIKLLTKDLANKKNLKTSHKLNLNGYFEQTIYVECANNDNAIATFDMNVRDDENDRPQFVFAYHLDKQEKLALQRYKDFFIELSNHKKHYLLKNTKASEITASDWGSDNDLDYYYSTEYHEGINGNIPISLGSIKHNLKILETEGDMFFVNKEFINRNHANEHRTIADIYQLSVDTEYDFGCIPHSEFKKQLATENNTADCNIATLFKILEDVEISIINQCKKSNKEALCEDDLILNPFNEYIFDGDEEKEFTVDNIHERKMRYSNELYIQDDVLIITSCPLYG